MENFIRLIGACLIFMCALNVAASAQEEKRPRDLRLFGVSRKLHARLEERLSQFIECQRSLECQALDRFVASFYFSDPDHKKSYPPSEKQKLIERIKQRPILALTVRQAVGSTANFSEPLRRRTWWIEGCAEFSEEGQIQKAEARVHIYFQRDWLFSPITVLQYESGSFVPCKK